MYSNYLNESLYLAPIMKLFSCASAATVVGRTNAVQGHVKTQLIEHDKEVYDSAFSRAGGGRVMFASVGVYTVFIKYCPSGQPAKRQSFTKKYNKMSLPACIICCWYTGYTNELMIQTRAIVSPFWGSASPFSSGRK